MTWQEMKQKKGPMVGNIPEGYLLPATAELWHINCEFDCHNCIKFVID
jgi:hypothetical protein